MSRKQNRVILYGDSLILAGARTILEASPDLEVVLSGPNLEQLSEAIHACCPVAIVFDLNAFQPVIQLTLLQQPNLLLIGLDSETHQALVWSSRLVAAEKSPDLLSIIADELTENKSRQLEFDMNTNRC